MAVPWTTGLDQRSFVSDHFATRSNFARCCPVQNQFKDAGHS